MIDYEKMKNDAIENIKAHKIGIGDSLEPAFMHLWLKGFSNGFDEAIKVIQNKDNSDYILNNAVSVLLNQIKDFQDVLIHISSNSPICPGCYCNDISLLEHYDYLARSVLEKYGVK